MTGFDARRFGIMALQLDRLLPPSASPEQAMLALLGFDHAALARGLAEPGFGVIELGGDLSIFLPQTFAPPAIAKLAALKQELGLNYTVHLPLWSNEPSTPSQPVRQGSVQALVEIVNATRPLEPLAYVLHATGALAAEFYRMRLPESARALILRQFFGNAQQSIRTLLAETGLPSRQLAVETIEFPFELTWQLAESLDTSLCLDTGHILAGFSGPVALFDVLEQVLPRLAEIHLHDSPQCSQESLGYGKDHQALGHGDLDTARLFERLQRANWQGPIVFELTLPQALESLQTISAL